MHRSGHRTRLHSDNDLHYNSGGVATSTPEAQFQNESHAAAKNCSEIELLYQATMARRGLTFGLSARDVLLVCCAMEVGWRNTAGVSNLVASTKIPFKVVS